MRYSCSPFAPELLDGDFLELGGLEGGADLVDIHVLGELDLHHRPAGEIDAPVEAAMRDDGDDADQDGDHGDREGDLHFPHKVEIGVGLD